MKKEKSNMIKKVPTTIDTQNLQTRNHKYEISVLFTFTQNATKEAAASEWKIFWDKKKKKKMEYTNQYRTFN